MIDSTSGAPRRAVIGAAAWSLPAVAVAVAAPNASASTPETDLALIDAGGGSVSGGGGSLRPGDAFEFHFALQNRGAETIPAGARVEFILSDTVYLDFFSDGAITGSGWSFVETTWDFASFRAVLGHPLMPGASSASASVTFTYPAGSVTRPGAACGVNLVAKSDDIIDSDYADDSTNVDLLFLRRYAVMTTELEAPAAPVAITEPAAVTLSVHNGGPNTIQGEPTEVWLEYDASFTEMFGAIDPDADDSALLAGSTPGWSIIDFSDSPTRSLIGFRLTTAINIGAVSTLVLTPVRVAGSLPRDVVVSLSSIGNREVEIQVPAGRPSRTFSLL